MRQSDPEYYSFDRVAGLYEETRYIPREQLDLAARLIVADARLRTGEPFLDAGVGTGRFARSLAAQGLLVAGVDVSEQMLATARRLSPNLNLLRGDLRRLPFRSAIFSSALAVHILHLIGDWHRVIDEIRRVISPAAPLYLGHETGRNFRARNLYFELADEREAPRASLGPDSFSEILQYLASTGAAIEQIDEGRLTWTASATTAEVLAILRQSAFSQMWHLPPTVNAALVDEVETRLLEQGVALDQPEQAPAQVSIWRARWDS